MSLYLSDVRIITSMYGRSLCSRNWKQMMWINSILQGKNEEKEMTLGAGQQRRPRKSPVRRTLNVGLNEETDH